jgi:O-antigen/teichoic acid export membrane protein/glycosyltransferase involved in cell wall biosynthesis
VGNDAATAMNDKTEPASTILLVSNTLWYLHTFRKRTIEMLLARGARVVCAGQDGPCAPMLREMGCTVEALSWRGDTINPLHEAEIVWRLIALILRTRPAFIFSFTVKANLNVSLAARATATPYATNVSGLGTPFLREGLFYRLVRHLFGFANAGAHTTFFQNPDDRDLFIQRRLSTGKRTVLLPGSGVDTERFAYSPPRPSVRRFLMIARLIRDKGVGEYLEAARILKARDPSLHFTLIGPGGVQNASALSNDEVQRFEDCVDYLGPQSDVRAAIADADCIVLPSYREGMPKVVLEAASIGRIAIVSDVPGCRHAIAPGDTGFLCPVRSSEGLAHVMREATGLGADEIARMSRSARERAVTQFDEALSIEPYLRIVDQLEHARAGSERSRSLVTQSFHVLALKGVNLALLFIVTMVLTRWLGPAGFGGYALVMAGLALLNIPIATGAANILLRAVARSDETGDWPRTKGGFRAMELAVVACGAGALGLALLSSGLTGLTALAVGMTAAIWLLDNLSALRAAVLRAFGKPLAAQSPDQVLKPALMLLLLCGYWGVMKVQPSLEATLGAFLVGSLGAYAAGRWLLATYAPIAWRARSLIADWSWVAPAAALTASSGLITLNAYMDTYVLAALSGAEEVGIYRVAFQVALVSALGYVSINLVASPIFARMAAKHDFHGLAQSAQNLARWAFVASLALPALLAVTGDALIAALFGDDFRHGYTAIMILLAGASINAIAGFGASILVTLHQERMVVAGSAAGLCVNLALSLLFIPRWGLEGAALASVAGTLLSNAVFVAALVKTRRINPMAIGSLSPRDPPPDAVTLGPGG